MKIHLIKEVKILLIIILTCILVLTPIYLVYIIKSPLIKTHEELLYQSTSSSVMDYKVQLMPNPIYNVRTLQSGQTYISIFTDTVDVTYKYSFKGNLNSIIQGDYDIRLTLEAYSYKDKELTILWSKKYPLIHKDRFNSNNDTYDIHHTFSIPLNQYLSFTQQLDKAFPISSQRRLLITCHTKMTSETDYGTISNDHTNRMIIPLVNNFYEIEGNLEEVVDQPIKTTNKVVIPVSNNKIIALSIIIFLTLLGLCYSIFFIIPIPIDISEAEANGIFKKHGSRLISIQMEMELLMVDKPIIYVRTFDGLVRISDELVQPIMYTYRERKSDINRFYVIHHETLYCHSLGHQALTPDEQHDLLSIIDMVEETQTE